MYLSLEGELVLDDFDIAQHAGSTGNGIVREFWYISAQNTLTVTLAPSAGSTVLCGIEVLAVSEPDFDQSGVVDYNDLQEFSDDWYGDIGWSQADLCPDGKVNLKDFAVFAEYWAETPPYLRE